LSEGNSKSLNKGTGPFQKGDNYKNKLGSLKKSQEPLSQKSSDLQESLLT
jgi:hypothetical protein